MVDVVFNKRSNEEVAVIIAGMETQGQRMPGIVAGLLQHDRFQLWAQEIVLLALVHQDMQFFLRLRNQCAGIILLPGRTVLST